MTTHDTYSTKYSSNMRGVPVSSLASFLIGVANVGDWGSSPDVSFFSGFFKIIIIALLFFFFNNYYSWFFIL